MIIKIGDLFSSKAQTLVNTVNCVGVMGKGIAQEFKKRYPEMYQEYVYLCENKQVKPGVPYYYSDLMGHSVLNFPTKNHWRSPSKLSYIASGLLWFRENYARLGITSVAFPPLGCGNGGLSWDVVGPLMYGYLYDLPIEIELYAPYGTSKEQLSENFLAKNRFASINEVIGAKKIPFNRYWNLILYVVKALNNDQYTLSVGRVIFQKICYILTRLGIPTGFHFVKSSYGPYAKEVKEAIIVLSNANLMTEVEAGRMVETKVSPKFWLNVNDYTETEMKIVDQAIDLLSRIKNTEQAEMMATVLFSFDSLCQGPKKPTEQDVFDYVMNWKPRWMGVRDAEVISTMKDLSELGYMMPDCSSGFIDYEEDLV